MNVISTEDDTDLGTFDPGLCVIHISLAAIDGEFTVLHELGHYVDYSVLGRPGLPASSTVRLRPWRRAVRQTLAFRAIEDRYVNPALVVEGVTFVAEMNDTDYYLRADELFARTYAQWIVEKGTDSVLLAQLKAAPSLAFSEPLLYATQWEAADFAPVAATFDELFGGLGWSKF